MPSASVYERNQFDEGRAVLDIKRQLASKEAKEQLQIEE